MSTADSGKKILVIASDEPIAEIVSAMLRQNRYYCEAVWEHKAILRVMRSSQKFDLLFCQVSALENEEKLLNWVLGPARKIPLVACAVRLPKEVPMAIYDRCTFLQVPFEKEQLVAAVEQALRGEPQNRG